ncbi:MAG: hypothetical protein QXO57_00895 [Candidatus Aenigmatarchaeota archaeon]
MKESMKFDEPKLEEAYQRVLRRGIFDKLKKMKIKPGIIEI